jgi:hypothetical protein
VVDQPKPESTQQNTCDKSQDASDEKAIGQPHLAKAGDKPAHEYSVQHSKRDGHLRRVRDWWKDPFRTRANWTDKAVVLLTCAIVLLAYMQWKEMHEAGGQTNQIISAARLIEAHQNQLVRDNRTALSDNRVALATVLKENRDELARVLQQNREATNAQTAALNGQLAAMQGQLEAADRPWMDVDILITSPLIYDGKTVRTEFSFVLSDIGRSPAQNISLNPLLTPAFMGDDLREIQKRACDDAARSSAALIGMGSYVLFPGHRYSQQVAMEIAVKDLDSHWGKLPPGIGPPNPIPIALVGCVDYAYESSTRRHQTAFAVDLLMKDRALPLKSRAPIAASDLILMPHPVNSPYPN